ASARWRISNGTECKIWNDPWFPRPISFKVLSPPQILDLEATVSELIDPISGDWHTQLVKTIFWPEEAATILGIPISIDPISGDWHTQLVKTIFWPEEAATILGIPISLTGGSDTWVWHHTRNSRFSVRSAYHVAQTLASINNVTPSSSSTSRDWKFIWALTIPNKVKMFAWRSCRNALPTAANVRSRIHDSDTSPCPSCGDPNEDIMHVLKHCSLARQVWALSGIPFEATNENLDNPEDWFRTVSRKLSTSEFRKFLVLCWSLWNARNKRTMEGLCYFPHQITDTGISFHSAFEEYNKILDPKLPQRRDRRWRVPPCGTIKINCDGALFQNEGEYAAGIVARDHTGQCLAWFSKVFQNRVSAEIAEATAILEGIELARRNDWHSITLETDCATLISKLLSDTPDLSPLVPCGNSKWTENGRNSMNVIWSNCIQNLENLSTMYRGRRPIYKRKKE
ncbi:UNVERIFIED_CONTAM: hypothetical protein Slati_4213900, partial [Sesamum latifolium]